MLAINGVYDKGKIELIKEVPIKGKRRVVVTFLDEPLVETDFGLEIDPIKALKGCARGLNLTEKLLESRKEDLNLEKSTLVHKDPEFEQLEDEVKVLKLPYKLI